MSAAELAASKKAIQLLLAFSKGQRYQNTFAVPFYQSLALSKVIVDANHPGTLVFSLKMPEFTRNAFDVCHGGALTTYVDIATTTAIYAFDAKSRTQVSAGLDMSFYSPALIGQQFWLEARVERFGKGICYSRADLKTEDG